MRCAAVGLLVMLAACGGGPTQGAVLTFQTPDGAVAATRIEVILANAADDSIQNADQRIEPGDTDTTTARYFRQRAIGGAVTNMSGLDGFEIRIEPDAATSSDEQFVPIVLVYDGDKLVGIGDVPGDDGDPSAVKIAPGVIATYDLRVSPVAAASSDEAAIDRGTVREVDCIDAQQQPWTSGYAWFPAGAAHQLRLLLPESGQGTDATARDLDLDCDTHAADSGDCDDLRPAFYPGARETCDGLDTNCDAQRWLVQGCNAQACATGVQICDDDTGMVGGCAPSAACQCANGTTSGCTRCTVDFTGPTAMRAACSPSVGQVHLGLCESASCTVEVAGATVGWRAFIGTSDAGTFSSKLTGVHSVFLEVKRSGTLVTAAGSIGEVYLLVTPANATAPTPLAIQLEMSLQSDACTPINGMPATSKMTCLP